MFFQKSLYIAVSGHNIKVDPEDMAIKILRESLEGERNQANPTKQLL